MRSNRLFWALQGLIRPDHTSSSVEGRQYRGQALVYRCCRARQGIMMPKYTSFCVEAGQSRGQELGDRPAWPRQGLISS